MLFSNQDRYHYARCQLREVICQLRFPTILSIQTQEPDLFQESIRRDFPLYSARKEAPPPRVTGAGTPQQKVETPPPVINHTFVSADGLWKINLTRDFFALSTLRYSHWEELVEHLDRPLAEFIRIYEPAFFQRIGLRYVNILSRKALDLEGRPWSALIQPAYLGVMAEPDVEEGDVTKSSLDTELKCTDGSHVKIHAGPGMVKVNNPKVPPDPEVKFILDLDCSQGGNTPGPQVPGTLDALHGHALSLFRGAITSELHAALDPSPM